MAWVLKGYSPISGPAFIGMVEIIRKKALSSNLPSTCYFNAFQSTSLNFCAVKGLPITSLNPYFL